MNNIDQPINVMIDSNGVIFIQRKKAYVAALCQYDNNRYCAMSCVKVSEPIDREQSKDKDDRYNGMILTCNSDAIYYNELVDNRN